MGALWAEERRDDHRNKQIEESQDGQCNPCIRNEEDLHVSKDAKTIPRKLNPGL